MTTKQAIIERNQRTFSQAILKQELRAIRKEREHLYSKALKRPLNRWEEERLSSIERVIKNVAQIGLEVLISIR